MHENAFLACLLNLQSQENTMLAELRHPLEGCGSVPVFRESHVCAVSDTVCLDVETELGLVISEPEIRQAKAKPGSLDPILSDYALIAS
jgi:hypothetical protein